MKAHIDLGRQTIVIDLPDSTDVLTMGKPAPIMDPTSAIEDALEHPIGAAPLSKLAADAASANPDCRVAVVISDNTRPVPYRGRSGILWPVVHTLIHSGVRAGNIDILVATGTHRALTVGEIRAMLDPRVIEAGVNIHNHNCFNESELAFLGTTRRGTAVYVNRRYLSADLKILTGLVESHFMAGASGGRKAICPGLVGEKSTYVFHSAEMLDSPLARDLVLDGNPLHEEALEVARKAGADFTVNVTLDRDMQLTGVFAGELDLAHRAAVAHLTSYVGIHVDRTYDVVVTHAGFVGLNHYQAAKAAVGAIPILNPDSRLILIASHVDSDPVGSYRYRTLLHLLKLIGAERFRRLILSKDWVFIPEQWQVQMWAKVFERIPEENMVYCATGIDARDYAILPGVDGHRYLRSTDSSDDPIPPMVSRAVSSAVEELRAAGKDDPSIALVTDGPYGVLLRD